MNNNSIENNQSFIKEDINVMEVLHLLKSNLKSIFLVIFIFMLLGASYLIVIRPTYHAFGTIIIEDENDTMSSLFGMGGLGKNLNFLDNEIEVLKSRSTTERAVTQLLNSKHVNDLYLFNTKESSDPFLRNLFRKILFLDFKNHQLNKIINNTVSDSLFNNFVFKLRESIVIENRKNTDMLVISCSSKDAAEATILVNTIIDVYQKRDQEWASGEMRYLKQFLTDQLYLKEIELDKIEQELKVFQQEEHIYGLDNNSNLLLEQLTTVESDYYNTEAKKNILQQRKKYFETQLSKDEKEFTNRVTNTLDVQLYSIRQELSNLEAEYISTKAREGSDHPAVIKLSKKIKSLKEILNKETKKYVNQGIAVANPIQYRQSLMDSVISIDAFMSGYNSKLIELKNLIVKYEKDLSSLPEKYLQFAKYERDKVILNETYVLMKQKLEEAKINEASQLGKIRVVDSAISRFDKSIPNKLYTMLIALFSGIFFGVLFVFLKEFLDSTIKSIEEIERRGLSILTIIPSINNFDERKKKKKGYRINLKLSADEKIERRLLTHEDPKSPISEAYRTLRTSLMFNEDSKGKIILVSSSGPGEGKTTTVANLAITFANMGKRTLLIDADLRKPVIHKMFKSNIGKGLTNYLTKSDTKISDIYYDSDVENLKIISAGIVPPNPSELLGSDNMDKFIRETKSEFDIILFDTPPMIAVTDAFIIDKFVDKTLLVIRASVTQKGALERTLVNIDNMSSSIDGVIFNGVNESNTYGGGYYYNYYQYYYGNQEKEE